MARPWENAALRPWETAQPLYERTIAIHRSKTVAAASTPIGLTSYSGREQSTSAADYEGETVLFTNLPASIQLKRPGRANGTLPADVLEKGIWNIFIPASALSQYSVRDRDIVYDDEDYRYAVAENVWTALGYQLSCIRLET